jgi:hypothetical protein
VLQHHRRAAAGRGFKLRVVKGLGRRTVRLPGSEDLGRVLKFAAWNLLEPVQLSSHRLWRMQQGIAEFRVYSVYSRTALSRDFDYIF